MNRFTESELQEMFEDLWYYFPENRIHEKL